MTAYGRKRTIEITKLMTFERPLLRKGDVQIRFLKIRLLNVRSAPESGRSANMGQKGR